MSAVSIRSSILSDTIAIGSEASDYLKQLDSIIAEAHHNLGCIGTETNNPEFTLAHFKEFNEMMKTSMDENLQREDKRLAISWNELGNAYMMNKMWSEGEQCFKKCLETARSLRDFKPAEFSFPFVNLGLAYWITDRFDEAADIMLQGLSYREAAFGRDDNQSFLTGRLLFGLGNVRASQGRLDESFAYHHRALGQFLSTIGKNHHRTGDVHVRVADHFSRLKRFDEARRHMDEALRIFQERAVYRPESIRATFRKSEILRAEGRVEEADKLRIESCLMYHDITEEALTASSELLDANFDDLVAFWSR
ncbi:MAG: hypothetical protein M1820_001505 [Bogoriella megaspora]|nr:MAG: hypothetical protein M1820_001505 [Bogoriella megaspora]